MVEGGLTYADQTEYTECWSTTWKTPYIMRLAFSAGLGGLLFGYDTGVISGALLYIREDFDSGTWRWMLGVAGVPAFLQFFLMLSLPESPRWLYRNFHAGACLAMNDAVKGVCGAANRTWYTQGCPSKVGFLAVIILGLYIIVYSPGMGSVPWIVNSEIYPLKYRGLGGGIAAVANWTSNLIVSETFLTLTEHLGSAGTFLLFAGFSFVGLTVIFFIVPETKGQL